MKTSHSKLGLNNTRCWSELRWFLVHTAVYMKLYNYMYMYNRYKYTCTNVFTILCDVSHTVPWTRLIFQENIWIFKDFQKKVKICERIEKKRKKKHFFVYFFKRKTFVFIPAKPAYVVNTFNNRPLSTCIFASAVWAENRPCKQIGTIHVHLYVSLHVQYEQYM